MQAGSSRTNSTPSSPIVAYTSLLDELAAGTADGGPLAVELIRILPLLTETLPSASIWLEISWFLEALFAHAGQLDRPSLAPGTRSHEDAASVDASSLCDWVVEYIDHPAKALSRSAQRAVMELLQQGNDVLRVLMRDYLSRDPTELGLITLSAAAMGDAKVLAPFREQLCQLLDARHFGVRRLAQRLCESLPAGVGEQMNPRRSNGHILPPAYDLAYPVRGSVHRIVDVETLLWQDGLYDEQPPKPKVEVGWGWIVKASVVGWAQIGDAYDVRSRCVCVMRKSQKVGLHRATALSAA